MNSITCALNNLKVFLTPEDMMFLKHTDFISDWQYVRSWGFDFRVLQNSYNTGNYYMPDAEKDNLIT